MGVWNSSRHTVQEMTPVLRARSLEQEMEGLVSEEACVYEGATFRLREGKGSTVRRDSGSPPTTHIFTSQDFSWLQKGQVNWVSRVPVIFFFGGGFRFDFLRPMSVGE